MNIAQLTTSMFSGTASVLSGLADWVPLELVSEALDLGEPEPSLGSSGPQATTATTAVSAELQSQNLTRCNVATRARLLNAVHPIRSSSS